MQRFVQALLAARVSGRPVADAQTVDARRIYRIFGKAIYRELGLDNVRHCREASIEVMRRRLLSLDFVLDHPDLPWLATEQEKIACFTQLGIDSKLLPKRIYYGRANGRVRYFHIKVPVAVEQDRAVFTYIDPGMGTPTELHSWGAAHQPLWQILRVSGRRVELVAVAWEQHLLDRAERVLTSWRGRGITEAEQEAIMLRQAVADTDWDIIERFGGFDAVIEKVLQVEKQSASTLVASLRPSLRSRRVMSRWEGRAMSWLGPAMCHCTVNPRLTPPRTPAASKNIHGAWKLC